MSAPSRIRLPLALATIGALSLAGQVVLLREASVAFFGVELVYVVGLGVWLLGSACGAALAPRRSGAALLTCLLVLLPLLVAAAGAAFRAGRLLTGGTPGAFLPVHMGLVLLLLGLGLPSWLAGAVFPIAARIYAREQRGSFARAYALECVGGVGGGLGVTAALALSITATAIVLVCMVVALGVAAVLEQRGRARWPLLAVAAGIIAMLLPQAVGLDRALTRIDHPDLIETADSPYARLVVDERSGQSVLFSNGALVAESQSVDAEAFVHPVLLQHARPRRVAVIEGTPRGLHREVARHTPETIVTLDLDPWAVAMAQRHVAPRDLPPRFAGHLLALTLDPRRFLRDTGDGMELFDVIVIGAADPESGQTNRYYTREMFALCADRLAPSGVLGLELRAAENLWSPLLTMRLSSIDRALRAELGEVLFLPGTRSVVIASRAALVTDPARLAARLRSRGIQGRLVSRPYLEYLFTNERIDEMRARLDRTETHPNTDARPVCYTTAAMLWLSRFVPSWGFLSPARIETLGESAPWLIGALLAALGFGMGAVGGPTGRGTMLAGLAGCAGMMAEGILVLHYQTQSGALFQDVGALLLSYMAGSALGAWSMDAWRHHPSSAPQLGALAQRAARSGCECAPRQTPSHRGSATGRCASNSDAAYICGALVVLGLASYVLVRHAASTPTSRPAVLALMALSGALVGALLCVAGHMAERPAGSEASPLYAADLLGGAFGALAASVVLIPLSGLDRTAMILSVMGLAAMPLVLRRPEHR